MNPMEAIGKWGEKLACSSGAEYWRNLDELAQTDEFREWAAREFPVLASEWHEGLDRRRFLQLMGASLALGGLTSCTREPIEKIMPYVHQPEAIVLGKPLYFATANPGPGAATGLLVESHEGRPTKVEGNPRHPISLGATSIFDQAAILDLYNPDRARAIKERGRVRNSGSFSAGLIAALTEQERIGGRGLRILTETVNSPSLGNQLRELKQKYPEMSWHQYDPAFRHQERAGSLSAFGRYLEPQYRFDRADVVVGFDADFLFMHPGNLLWARQFASRRRLAIESNRMNRMYMAEPTPTVTGSMAEHRLPIASRDVYGLLVRVAEKLGITTSANNRSGLGGDEDRWTDLVVRDLEQHRGRSLIVVGETQPPEAHQLAHALNFHLQNAGRTVLYTQTPEVRPEDQIQSVAALTEALLAGEVDVLLVMGGNPVFTAPSDIPLGEHLGAARYSVHLNLWENETSRACQWFVPQAHFLESWSDARALDGTVTIVQPLIAPLYGGQTAHELLDQVLRVPSRAGYQIVREYWAGEEVWANFEEGWQWALRQGLIEGSAFREEAPKLQNGLGSVRLEGSQVPGSNRQVEASEVEVIFRPDPSVWDGRFIENAWLQELPRPLTKLTWDNAILISVQLAERLGLKNEDVVFLEHEGRAIRGPVLIAPGQAKESVTLHLGYGREVAGAVGASTGFDCYPLRRSDRLWHLGSVSLRRTDSRHPLAITQNHHLMHGRRLVRAGTLEEFRAEPGSLAAAEDAPHREETLYNPAEYENEGYAWGMAIDLGTCIGCSACVIACQAENNIPVVGKEQVKLGREMLWIRVDSYFKGSPQNPQMYHQPVPCMHCENAPCELVCPVFATVHDAEGLNLQVYNRCVGTRYCSNNCPYKVRRFNFLDYVAGDPESLKLMRNPDVTVRWKGIMEKCTYCIQRISAARIEAKKESRKLKDGEVQTACQQACPTEAIVFGDLHNRSSAVWQMKEHPLNYAMLAELNTRPRTTYLAKVWNPQIMPSEAGMKDREAREKEEGGR